MANYDSRLRRLEERSADTAAPKPITRILYSIVAPAIGVVGVMAEDFGDGSRKSRKFERIPGESVEDLQRRVRLAMGWNNDRDPRADAVKK